MISTGADTRRWHQPIIFQPEIGILGILVKQLDYFRERDRHRVIADVRQSEQGSWFLLKRNRNMLIEVAADVPVLDGFHWLTIQQIHELLKIDDLSTWMPVRCCRACRSSTSCRPRWRSTATNWCSRSSGLRHRHGWKRERTCCAQRLGLVGGQLKRRQRVHVRPHPVRDDATCTLAPGDG